MTEKYFLFTDDQENGFQEINCFDNLDDAKEEIIKSCREFQIPVKAMTLVKGTEIPLKTKVFIGDEEITQINLIDEEES